MTESQQLNMQTCSLRLALMAFIGFTLAGCPDPAPSSPSEIPDAMVEVDQRMTAGEEPDMMVPDMEAGTEVDMEVDMDPPPVDHSCTSCEDDDECGEGYLCVAFDEDSFDQRCFMPCSVDDEEGEQCDEGFSCLELSDELAICVKDDQPSCELCYDPDGDGYGAGGYCEDGDVDCDSADASINPGVRRDLCDGVDNNCDGEVDEDFEPTRCDVGTCQAESSCVDGVESACEPPMVSASDITCDGQDDDCDGSLDEDYVAESCGDGVCAAVSDCVEGSVVACMPLEPRSMDDASCNGIDENCNGQVDEDFTGECGLGICRQEAICASGVDRCTALEPEQGELDNSCDLVDQDCDGEVDEGFTTTATCGLGACQVAGACVAGAYACEALTPSASDDTTCDGIDEDCDGEIDEDCQVNTLSVAYNATLSTASVIALDVYYEQAVSPVREASTYQPRLLQLAITPPAGVFGVQPEIEGSAYVRGEIGNMDVLILPPAIDAPLGTLRVEIGNTFNPAAPRILPADSAAGRAGKVITIMFARNNAASPLNFTWHVGYTQMAPIEALQVMELTPIPPIIP